jgi:hypothetical protein
LTTSSIEEFSRTKYYWYYHWIRILNQGFEENRRKEIRVSGWKRKMQGRVGQAKGGNLFTPHPTPHHTSRRKRRRKSNTLGTLKDAILFSGAVAVPILSPFHDVSAPRHTSGGDDVC